LSVGGTLFRVGWGNAAARSPATTSSDTYELRRTPGGWLLMVDEKLIMHCNTLPEANLALIAARAAHRSPERNPEIRRRDRQSPPSRPPL
jgi:hypothetical protein